MPGYSWNGSAWKKVLRKTMWTGSAWKDIKSSHRWTGSAWETIYSSFTPSGMTKNGTAYATTSTFTQVPGMTADAGSTLSGSALLPNGSKAAATISGQVSITDTGFGGVSFTVEVRKNGVLIPDASVTDKTYLTKVLTIPTVTTSVTGSDQISLWVKLGSTATTVTVTAGSNTWVRIT
ncbi:hypothetical protein BKP42_35860 [Rhodococcus erythropolis]|uniref:hypothetical protein n=1 Tax=Rhodococcus erythropolis TaxID=1833 RepID=UPI000BB35A95|nr:hypothetical protein [Rhodococcus erythropolis]PBI96926.1 hypothetical protein BKP42_35860 [Rhodococcus erythropolis]